MIERGLIMRMTMRRKRMTMRRKRINQRGSFKESR
jgi:hypothetical protein